MQRALARGGPARRRRRARSAAGSSSTASPMRPSHSPTRSSPAWSSPQSPASHCCSARRRRSSSLRWRSRSPRRVAGDRPRGRGRSRGDDDVRRSAYCWRSRRSRRRGSRRLLFGDILGVTDADLATAAGLAALARRRRCAPARPAAVAGFDRGAARSLGVSPAFADAALLVLLAAAIVVAVQGLGNLLVVAVFVGPAAAARQLTDRMLPMMLARRRDRRRRRYRRPLSLLLRRHGRRRLGGAGDRRRLPDFAAAGPSASWPAFGGRAAGGYDRLRCRPRPTAPGPSTRSSPCSRPATAAAAPAPRWSRRLPATTAPSPPSTSTTSCADASRPSPAPASTARSSSSSSSAWSQRLEVSRGTAGYERVEPGGEHHHHAICRRCGRMVPFEDPGLERAIARLSGELSFEVTDHDVVLRGLCERCR